MRILVVDDNDDVRRIIAHMLRQHGFEVVTAADGMRALEAVAESRPDAVVLDIMMPEVSGLDALKQLREHAETAAIPVLLVTALDRDTDVIAGYQAGGDYYITKPFTAPQLLYAVDLVLTNRGTGKRATEMTDSRRESTPAASASGREKRLRLA
jgi:two-component system OmpR family response regulator